MPRISKLTFLKQFLLILSLTFIPALSISNNPALAEDPFRTKQSRDIGEYTETAFKTLFFEGDYKTVNKYLNLAEAAETNEPLAYAIKASLAYTEEDWGNLKTYALKTLETAQKLQPKDPVRGNLYLGVGHFLDGAYVYEKEGAIGAIQKLQLVFKYLDEAEDSDPNDPELNLIKGYMDLLLAVNLPFSSPEQAIERFQKYAAPNYLVERGLAVAYRDLKQYDKALEFANKALKIAPDNPEHFYLKGQILRQMGKKQKNISILEEALNHFDRASSKSAQLPKFITKPLEREIRQTKEKIDEIKEDTGAEVSSAP